MTIQKQERMPPLSLQFQQGTYAFQRGWVANAYNRDSIKGKEWQRGWDAAYFGNLDRVVSGERPVRAFVVKKN